MRSIPLFIIILLFASGSSFGQYYKVYGKIINSKLEPLAFVSVQVKEFQSGTTSKEDGSYELQLEPGKYDLAFTMVGYKSQLITVIVSQMDYKQNIILETDESKGLSEVFVKGKAKDKAEQIIRNVIREKESLESAAGAYSCKLYIKAVQEDSSVRKKSAKKPVKDTAVTNLNAELNRMAMAEIITQLDIGLFRQVKEERIAVKKRGNAESLFYLSATEGDFNLYHNLLKTPALSQVPFLSPLSYSGLIAYRYKTLKTEIKNGKKFYTISVRPRQMSNATMEAELVIEDSSWVMVHAVFRLPAYHLPEYDFFEVEQEYEFVNDKAWMIRKQFFNYYSKSGRGKKSGQTTVSYQDFELNKQFGNKYFGNEISVTAQEAYDRDSSYWEANRTEPLTPKELRFIHYKDSIYHATHTKAYLDSLDRKINKITLKKVLLTGQSFNDHEKQRTWNIPPIPSFYQPFQMGGTRIQLAFSYHKTFKSRKNIFLYNQLSYGLRNKDMNGEIRVSRMYNPFNRGFYHVYAGRRFQNIFEGDAWINMLKRSNIYLNNSVGGGHGLELVNGLFFYTDLDIAIRKSVSDYKTGKLLDSSFVGDILDDNHAVPFQSYNAVYGKIRLQYTPGQRYIREPREKIILGSAWPTFYISWKKGIPDILGSKIDFDYLEFGMEQQIKLGLFGTSNYTIKSGKFLNRKDLRLVDYQFQRRGDPILFLNPNEAFQALDSSFPLFKRFYQAHYVHEFNGALINKIPIFKKLQLREIAGSGFLIAPERNLRYFEIFGGIERVFKWPFNLDSKFKLGVYVVASAANQFRNPVQFKIGITSWDKRRNKWN